MRNITFQANRGRLAFVVFGSLFLLMFLLFYSKFQFASLGLDFVRVLASVFFFDRFFVEYLSVTLIASFLVAGPLALRLVGYFLFSFFYLLNIVQFISLQRGRELVSPVALENIGHIGLLLSPLILTAAFLLLLFFIVLPWSLERFSKRSSRNAVSISMTWMPLVIVLLLILTFQQSRKWLPPAVVEARRAYFIENNVEHTSPALALFSLLSRHDRANANSSTLSAAEALEARKFGIIIDTQKQYPFVSEEIYKGQLPFEQVEGKKTDHPNVIVFFTEGMSARTINAYGSSYPGITPNIDAFAKDAMLVKNYYNHTAATYRGLLGQYCSLFPTFGGMGGWDDMISAKIDRFCINKVLNLSSYHTVFFDTHRKDDAYVDEMMRGIGMDEVKNAEDIARDYLGNAKPLRWDALSDHQFFDGFIGWLKKGEKSEDSLKKPFMVGLYNLETHAFQNVGADGVPYREGGNNALNTVHNYDDAFGKFWTYFKASPYFDNTIVILTADHSHYSEESFVAAHQSDADYQSIFIDRIPLIIYDPTHKLPSTFDANYATSIDFAPSLAHLLELPNIKNPFLGSSIFSPERKVYEGMGLASIGEETFIVDKEMVHQSKNSKSRAVALKLADKVMKYAQRAEVENRIWDKTWDQAAPEQASSKDEPSNFSR